MSHDEALNNLMGEYAATGSQSTFASMIELLEPRLTKFARKLVPECDVEDLVQDTWLRIMERREDYDIARGSAFVWAGGLLRNAAKIIQRNNARYEPLCHAS